MNDYSLKVGDQYHVWWSTGSTPENMATILDIRPYNGIFKEHYNVILKLTAPYPATKRGWLEMTAKI
jgi:hypothetical protein